MYPELQTSLPQQPQIGGSAPSAIAQNTSLLGNQQFLPQNQPVDFNTTAPSSGLMHPGVQNMIKALQGGV